MEIVNRAFWLVTKVLLVCSVIGRQHPPVCKYVWVPPHAISSFIPPATYWSSRLSHPVPCAKASMFTIHRRTGAYPNHPSTNTPTTRTWIHAASAVLWRERSSRPPITTQWKIFHQTLLGYDHMVWKFIYLRKSFLIRPTTDDHARVSAPGIPCAHHRRPTSYHTKHQFRDRDSFESCAQR